MESISNIVNKSALETATTTAAITSPSAPASALNLQQRIAKRRRDWTLTLTDGPVSSPGPKAKYRRSRSWSTRIGVDAPLNAERQIPVLYAIAMSKSKSNIPSSPTSSTSSSSSSSAIEGIVNDEYPPDAEEYRICPDTDSPRYKHESDVGLWSGPRSSPGPRARYARSRSWSSRQSDSGYSSGEDCVVGESESDDGCRHYTFLSGADYLDSESGSKCSKGDDDIAMTDVPLIGVSGYGDIIMVDISPMEFPGDGDVVMVDASPIGASGDDDVIMAEYEDDDEDISMADYGGDDDVSMADYVEDDDVEMSDYSEDVDVEMAEYDDEDVDVVMADSRGDSDSDIEMFDHVEDTRTNVFDYREAVGIDNSSESGDSVDDSLIVHNSEYEDSEDFDLAMGYYSDSDDSSDGGDYPGPDIALADDNDTTTVITWSLGGTTLLRDSPNGSGGYSPLALSDRPEPDLVTEYTLTRWANGVSERMIYVDFDYSDIECDEELPVVELRLPEDEKDHYE
ncbi:hypothetical protein CNYM01_09889 [Colletotrichum nymphaeae SA-01]|uniref:Uncharacterized protein n=1 Tax=Colletotrichum nymphaeae SA-01 TaxID=1460502 RepID=A0A135TS37_9PEZI|nr:hypothetical protein CNYM01_09889 [Colletotrichum nymphaeae SA-01]